MRINDHLKLVDFFRIQPVVRALFRAEWMRQLLPYRHTCWRELSPGCARTALPNVCDYSILWTEKCVWFTHLKSIWNSKVTHFNNSGFYFKIVLGNRFFITGNLFVTDSRWELQWSLVVSSTSSQSKNNIFLSYDKTEFMKSSQSWA